MNSKLLQHLSILLMTLTVIFVSCKNGDPGPAGTAGTNGTNGSNGTNGAGYDEAVKNGGFTIFLDGKRPDGVLFKDTLKFMFSPTDLDYSSYYTYNSTDHDYYLKRFTGMDNLSEDNNAAIDFEVWEEEGTTYYYFDLELKSSIATSDAVYFNLNEEFYDGDGSNVSNPSYTNISYNSDNGNIQYKFSFTSIGDNNATGYDLNVSGIVNATVYTQIEDDDDDGGRKSPHGGRKIALGSRINRGK